MKKKQQDFQKVKLRVGKHLPKGRNETKTSFQTRKINLREQIKETAEVTTLKDILGFMKSTDVKIKYDNLRRLYKYIVDNEDNLPMFFPDILKDLGRILLESDSKVRSEAISVLKKCIETLTDIQFKSFAVPLTSYLNCMMTHPNTAVIHDSLGFVSALLEFHPNIICQSNEILFYLLNLISTKETSTVKKSSKNKDVRKLTDHMSSKITADNWRINVLEQVHAFLSRMLSEKNSTEIISDHQKEVYWNAKEALYLPLYLNSGVEPAEFDYSLYSSHCSKGRDSKEFKNLIFELICVLSAILKGFSTGKSFSEENIKCLNLITEILCCTGEWAIQNLDMDNGLNPVEKLIPICEQLLKSFPYSQQAGKGAKKYGVECIHLNLEIAYLYCICSFLSDIPAKFPKSFSDKWELIKMYLAAVFEGSGVKMNEKAISLTLKICKILLQCVKLDESAKDGVLVALLGTLETNKFSASANDIYTFFMDLSLNYDHKNLLTTQAMRSWFQSLIKNLIFMVESKNFVPNYLSYIKQICTRRNPCFMETLKSLPYTKLIEFLKLDDEDFQFTIIHLIISLDEFTPEFFQDLAETIRYESFSLKTASRLIRMLHTRFSVAGVPLTDQMNFLKFLLNLGCDTFLISNPSLDTEPLPLTDTLVNFQLSFACSFEIYPTSDFERHQEIFKVCLECLPSYLKNETLGKCTAYFIRAIFREYSRYPVHSLVAIIELFKRFSVLYSDTHGSVKFLQNFVYSCLLYNSFITHDVPEEHWTVYCVPAVQDCLDIVDPSEMITFMERTIQRFDENQLYHVLRVIIFLIQRGLLDAVDKTKLYVLFNKLSKLEAYPKRPVLEIMLENMYHYLSNS